MPQMFYSNWVFLGVTFFLFFFIFGVLFYFYFSNYINFFWLKKVNRILWE